MSASPKSPARPLTSAQVREHFNAVECVVHYTRAAHRLGLWASERLLIERFFPDRTAALLEAGCGAGRATIALWELGYRRLTAFDFAEELVEQAQSLARERGAAGVHVVHADACAKNLPARLASGSAGSLGAGPAPAEDGPRFAGALFLFNGLMQIPGRRNRRRALRNLAKLVVPGGRLLFTTHDRDDPTERDLWPAEAKRWAAGKQDPRLRDYGDRYFAHDHGHTFMHLPVRREILADLAATGWAHEFDTMRRDVARESNAVKDFSDECRFWVAQRA